MKAKLLLFFFCLSVLSGIGQGTIKRNKCKTCGKVISQCPHKGKHPKPAPKPESKPKSKPKPESKPKPNVNQNLTISVGNVNFVMVKVSGGTFTMGATSEMTKPYSDEKPTHRVTLSSYYIGETEVTQALWKAVMGNNPSDYIGDDLPVESVSWYDCQTFISKLNTLTGKNFRLPTEAEWEFAARGGNQSRHTQYSGSSRIDDVAWYDNKTHPVKTKQPNELGIYDMAGNVYEWCQDWYGSYSSYAQTNPTGASNGFDRVLRGGSWGGSLEICRSSYRNSRTPERSYDYLGLRLVLSQ